MTLAHAVPPRAARALPFAVAAIGCAALAARTLSTWSLVATALVGIAGVVTSSTKARPETSVWIAVVATGVGGFAIVRFTSAALPNRLSGAAILTIVVAAIAEEPFFRGLVYGLASARGALAAIVVSSVAFGLIHVPMYGFGALPIDVAAGLVFGWQRQVTGGWTAPAATHVVANLMQMG